MTRKKLLLGGCCTLLIGGAALGLIMAIGSSLERWELREYPEIALFDSIQPGMTEEAVRGLVGDPGKVYRRDTAPEHYYVSGYTYEKREITNKVLIYWFGGDLIAYVYVGPGGTVEHVFIGGS